MRCKFAMLVVLLGGLALLLDPIRGLAQPPGRDRGGRGGGRGGGGGNRAFDPNRIFDFMARGQPTINIADMRRGQDEARAWAQKNGITNGQLTRVQFAAYMQSRNTGGAAPGAPAAPPGGGGGKWGDPDARATELFRRADKNSDGFLDYNEMSETLRAELDKWDVNKDKLIDLNEYKEFLKAFEEKRRAERGETPPGDGRGPDPVAEPEKPKFDLDKKITVYRAGKLPPNLPKWFKEYDLDGDAQIALYEWKEKGGTVTDFQKLDLNGDGFLTIEELQKSGALANKDSPVPGKTTLASGGGDWSARFFDRMSGGKPTIVIADVAQDTSRERMLEWAQKNNITNGQLTREQFSTYMQEQRGGFGGGRPGGGNRRGGR